MLQLQERIYTIKDIYSLPDGQRAELIDGRIYMMAPPGTKHQEISGGFYHKIRSYIDSKISVICDKNKTDDRGCHGAPDWIIEIVSPSTQQVDYGLNLFKYHTAGVKEYWIVNPSTHIVIKH